MGFIRCGLVYLFLLSLVSQAEAMTLNQRWEIEQRAPFEGLSSEVLETLRGKHVLFISGIMNELADASFLGFKFIESYYKSNKAAVRHELGMTYDYYGPYSGGAVHLNSYDVYSQIMRAYSHSGKPLIVIAHSKGGAETLHAIMRHPDVILKGYVEKVILIQSAIGGSPIATTQESRGLIYDLVSWFVYHGVKSLETDRSKSLFDQAFQMYDKELRFYSRAEYESELFIEGLHQRVSDRIFYVRAHETRENLSWGIRTVNDVCGVRLHDDGMNDGLLMLHDQKHPRIGVDLGVLSSDHIGLTVDYFSSTTSSLRRAFTRAVLSHVYSSDAELEDTSMYDVPRAEKLASETEEVEAIDAR